MSGCDPLTLKVCGTSDVTWSQFPAELLKIWQIFAPLRHAVTLTFDPLILNVYCRSGVMQ